MSNVSSYAIVAELCLQTVISCISLTISQYIYAFYLQTYPYPSNYTTTTSTSNPLYISKILNNETEKCSEGNIAPDTNAQAWAQQRSADLLFWTNLMSSCPVIIMTYILGLYTPQLGKRLVILLPMLGMKIQIAIWLAIIYFRLSEYWWYIAAIISGLSGSTGVFSMNVVLGFLMD